MLDHACPACGYESRAGGVRLLQEGETEDEALRRAQKNAPPEVAELIGLVRERLKHEDRVVDSLGGDLKRIFGRVVETLEAAAQGRSALRANILQANTEGLMQLLDALGFLGARVEHRGNLQRILDLANEVPRVQGVPAGIVRLDTPAIRALVAQADETFWKGKIQQPAANIIREGLDRALRMEPLEQTVRDIAQRLDTSIGRAMNAARTEIAQFDRTVNTQVAISAGLRKWLYLGPRDGLTRPFCRALIGKVVDYEQMGRLDNGQGIGNPLTSGGGFNCRHRWVAASDGLIERRELPLATEADIKAANVAGKRGKR